MGLCLELKDYRSVESNRNGCGKKIIDTKREVKRKREIDWLISWNTDREGQTEKVAI